MDNLNGVPNNEPKKKKGKGKWIVLVIVAVIIIAAIASGGKNDDSKKASTSSSSDESKNDSSSSEKEEEIEYTSYHAQELVDDIKANALNASDKYKNQYIEVTGVLSNIDSSGKYISISAATDDYSLVSITCNIKNDSQKDKVKELSTGSELTIKGKVTDVGEVLGYTIDIDEIN